MSRPKLAYLIDATAAPVCMIAPISSWAAAVSSTAEGLNTGMSGIELFTSSTEGRIYRELGDALSGMVESFSFTSLAEKILSVEGGAAVQTLSDAGRTVLVRRALEELQENVDISYRPFRKHRRLSG